MSDLSDAQRIINAGLRSTFPVFVQRVFQTLNPTDEFIAGQHIYAICHHLEAVINGETSHLLITVPPRHLKSICTAIALPAWLLGKDPSLRFIVASYGQELAQKHSEDFQKVITSQWYQNIFPNTIIKSDRKGCIETTQNGYRLSVSVGATVTGLGADYLIVDDLMKASDARSDVSRELCRDFYDQSLYTRINNKSNPRVIAIQQRLHEDDLAAHLLDKGNFTHLNLPAIAEQSETIDMGCYGTLERNKGDVLFPERESLDVLEGIKQNMGNFAFSTQYQQNPVLPDGNYIRWEWFGEYDNDAEPFKRSNYHLVVQSWDTASSLSPHAAYSVCLTWGFHKDLEAWHLLDVMREKLEYPDLKDRAYLLHSRYQPSYIIIERKDSGLSLFSELRKSRIVDRGSIRGPKPKVSKSQRMEEASAVLRDGDFCLPKSAAWLPAFKREIQAFPYGKYKDQVDAFSQFLISQVRQKNDQQYEGVIDSEDGVNRRDPIRRDAPVRRDIVRRN